MREMAVPDVGLLADCFSKLSAVSLASLGLADWRCLTRAQWQMELSETVRVPPSRRENFFLVWELDGHLIGFSIANAIKFGEEARMHIRMIDQACVDAGKTTLVRRSVDAYFETLKLRRLYYEPDKCDAHPTERRGDASGG